ncbi:MAG: hypothetical protein A3F82_07935 [Deltaproteobacteria bacterium RIFCSPLOWO2_12_FULL_44_12]|nr:MAG: hypothetical protein A3I70_03585 [Deltaproteobacteria bacterium RIFCSPLOWO2_02_FULL_44_34]OGQ70124.1 MAG: hypothetical protein A3F82_07935 [Deltaproteobacteria bacterium RIFCSPLOWO2_12_FULL_44_12]
MNEPLLIAEIAKCSQGKNEEEQNCKWRKGGRKIGIEGGAAAARFDTTRGAGSADTTRQEVLRKKLFEGSWNLL